jgi:Lrp/AsnC family transcriptional regulator for asnA, asnC and gidA
MPYELDAVDRKIIGILQQDGRTPNVETARHLGVSEATVRKRLERMVSEDVIRITAIPNPSRVGLSTVTFLTLDVDLAQLDRVTDQLAQLPEVRAIYYTSGESDLIVEAWFASADELLHFLTQRVASIPGIRGTATSHVLRTIKDGSRWALPRVQPPRILVVDDDPDFLEIIRRTLGAEGYEVACAACGEEALASARVSRPDLVILDIMMRGVLDGLRTAQEIRSDGALRSVPILLVSSIGDSPFGGFLPRPEALPADNLLVKPIDCSLLLAETRRLLRMRI